jgi:hypothetical protein
MTIDSDFKNFLSTIEPSKTDIDYISSVHTNLRDFLETDLVYKDICRNTYLSGSYANHTCIKPQKNDGRTDVDIVVLTSHSIVDRPSSVLSELQVVLLKKEKYKTAKLQSHSIGINMAGIDIDVTPLVTDNKGNYYVGSTDDSKWKRTDPKSHIQWSTEINAKDNGKFKPLVKMLKWWRRKHCPLNVRYPKGITLEKMIADNIGDTESSYEELCIGTMRNIVDKYEQSIGLQRMPTLEDPTIIDNDLFDRYKLQDLSDYVNNLSEHLDLITEKGTNNDTWREIFGDEFPKESTGQRKGELNYANFSKYLSVGYRQKPPWAVPFRPSVFIKTEVVLPDGTKRRYVNDGYPLPKRTDLYYTAACGVKRPFTVKWQIVNSGEEARNDGCLRGGFEDSGNSEKGDLSRKESTAYAGKHYVQCFIIQHGRCVAKSQEFFINVADT